MTAWTIESLARFFKITDDADVHDGFWWRANEPQYEPFTILINCNDLFWWTSSAPTCRTWSKRKRKSEARDEDNVRPKK